MINFKEVLNNEQYQAVTHKDGPMLIFAGAGSGKTRVITYRIYNLVEKEGVNPGLILAVTFTNKAAEEMRNRVEQLLGYKSYVTVSTFHSLGLKILKYYGKEIGIKSGFVIYDDDDQEQLIKKILKKTNIDIKEFKPSAYQNKFNRFKDNLYTIDLLKNNSDLITLPSELEIFEEYERQKSNANALDFADLIYKTVELLKQETPSVNYLKSRYNYVMVDEFQDTNLSQYTLLKLLCAKHNNICVVGDDDQSIYSWRGAMMMNILNFEKDFKNTRTIKLEQNYRSTQKILEISNLIVKNNKIRAEKTLFSTRKFGVPPVIKSLYNDYEEAEYIAEKIIELKKSEKYDYHDFAIFFRTNNQSRIFEEKLREYRIPHLVIGAISFYNRKEIKDLTAYLKFITNPDDTISLQRIINMPKRNIGDATLEKILTVAAAQNTSAYKIISNIDNFNEFNSGTKLKLKNFSMQMQPFIERALNETADTLLTDLVEEIQYRDIMENSEDVRDNARVDNINEFINSACEFVRKNSEFENNEIESDIDFDNKSFTGTKTSDFLEKIMLFSETDKIDSSKNYVSIMTYHCAKGLEFPVVFMVGIEEEILPHYNALSSEDDSRLEEERRLCYVGITRAKDIIYLTHAMQRYKFGDIVYPKISRFILEAFPEYIPDYKKSGISKFPAKNTSTFEKSYANNFSRSTGTTRFSREKNYDAQNYNEIQTKRDPKQIKENVKVIHPKFGPGKILWVNETGDKIKVSFPKVGIKLLATEFANLKIL
ncbi:UvrD-helicase domain-containing protein [Candidatus Dependentiae bacterium]|nr:UvrD-helicase domain-containing protein [Candidatus Dependentiae bacterium]